MSEEARAVILVRLTKLVSEDPVPTVMAALSVPERRSLTRFSQPDLHTRLAALDWEAILDEAIPRELSGAYNPAALASALNAACALLSF